MFARPCEAILQSEMSVREICMISPEDIRISDSYFSLACGICTDVLTIVENLVLCPDIAMCVRPNPNDRLPVTGAALEFCQRAAFDRILSR